MDDNNTFYKKAKGYLRNKDLLNELKLSKEKGELTKEALGMFILMVKNISKSFSYKNPEDRKDAIQVALMKCLLYWKSFNPEKSNNPFSYFTQVIKNGFAEGFNQLHPEKDREGRLISLNEIQFLERI